MDRFLKGLFIHDLSLPKAISIGLFELMDTGKYGTFGPHESFIDYPICNRLAV